MRLIATIAAAICAVAAHATHLAPWNPGVGVAAGIAVGLHGTDVALSGYYTMVNGTKVDTLTSQGMQTAGLPQDAANGIDAGLSIVGMMGVGVAIRAAEAGLQSVDGAAFVGSETAVQKYFPINDGVIGEKTSVYLYKGTLIDRYGGGPGSVYFSPVGTPAEMRALPQSSIGAPLRTFIVEKPIPVEQGVVAPAFNQIGGGIQYRTPVGLGTLLERGILREIR